jgi:hypothetical protein
MQKIRWRLAAPIAALSVGALASPAYVAWPTGTPVTTADKSGAFGENMSGLFYQPAAAAQAPVLWAVQNSPSRLHKLAAKGKLFVDGTAEGWSAGKTLRYPDGHGAPDAEGVTMAELGTAAVYVSTERDGDGPNRFSVLRFETGGAGTTLKATNEWNLTADLPPVKQTNLGLEAIAWVPDGYLVGHGFIDDNTRLAYDPADYDGHGSGLFLVGLEFNGQVYAYALNQAGSSYVRIASFASGNKQIMDLSFDRDNGILWAWCDDGCDNRSNLLAIDTTPGSPTRGRFVIRKSYERPGSMPDTNNEGIAIAPESECADQLKPFFWADDAAKGGHALRRGTVPCGPLF